VVEVRKMAPQEAQPVFRKGGKFVGTIIAISLSIP
jgi:hypothetical protein